MASSNDKMKTDLEDLKKHIQSQSKSVKILENIGESNSFVIKFTQFNEFDLNLTIQTSNELINANIILYKYGNSQKNSESKIAHTQLELESYFKKLASQEETSKNVFIEFYLKAIQLINQSFETKKSTLNNNEVTKESKKEVKNATAKNDTEVSSKKNSMKTSEDVINRIFWDQEINKEYITVGYLDRFLGIKEVLFNLFDWGDIVEADINSLAIPRHRIHYFKYKNETIWDKKTRLDNVFGSTGSNITIHDVINRLKTVDFNPVNSNENEIVQNRVGRPRPEKNNDNATNASTKTNPNYFISIPIKNAELKENLFNLQCDLIDSNKSVQSHLLPDTSYHITLCTLRADSDEELETVKNLMDILFTDEMFMSENFPLSLSFEGIGEFFNKVLFVKCNCNQMEKLEYVKRTLLKKFENSFVNVAGNYYEFMPHLTIFKMNKNSPNDSVESLVNKYIWNEYENLHFGNQKINEISLCKMGNIYELKSYHVEHTVKI